MVGQGGTGYARYRAVLVPAVPTVVVARELGTQSMRRGHVHAARSHLVSWLSNQPSPKRVQKDAWLEVAIQVARVRTR